MAESEFDDFAQSYDEDLAAALQVTGESKEHFMRGRVRWLADNLDESFKSAVERVLDFGSGTGTAIDELSACFGNAAITAFDVSEHSLNIARSEVASSSITFTSSREPEPGVCDLAYCNGVFHHIAPSERQESLDYISQSLKPGGYFALFENNPWSPATRYVMSRCVFDRDAIVLFPSETRQRLRDTGFEVVKTRYLFIFPAVLRMLRWMEFPLSALPLGGQYVVLARKPLPEQSCGQ